MCKTCNGTLKITTRKFKNREQYRSFYMISSHTSKVQLPFACSYFTEIHERILRSHRERLK